MSRSGYYSSDDCDGEYWDYVRWRGTVARATKGKRGQDFLKELAKEMDAMPEKILIANELIDAQGQCCTIGVVLKARGVNVSGIDVEDPEIVAANANIARALAAEIEFENDERNEKENPSERWIRMRKWVSDNIQEIGG